MRGWQYIVLLTGTFLLSCGKGGGDKSKAAPSGISINGIVSGGTLVIGLTGEPDALNPLTALSIPGRDIISLVFRRLADINEDLVTFSPKMAKSWEFSPDSLAITFHLRTDILWHDSIQFSAQDVVFTYNLQVDPEVAWDGVDFKKDIREVAVRNDSTVVFIFNKRTPTMLMDAVEGYLIPAHLLAGVANDKMRETDFNRNPVGTGPFRFEGWKSQQSVILEKFDGYYIKGQPYLDRVIFKVVTSTISLWQQVRSGDIDFMEKVPPRDFARLVDNWEAGKSDVRPISYLGRNYDFIGWNLIDAENYAAVMEATGAGEVDFERLLKPNKLFGHQKVRAAVTMAIDRRTLANVVNQGMAIQMDGPIPPILGAYNQEANTIWEYNPELAVQYLKEEGWEDTDGDGVVDKDGLKFSFEMLTNSGNDRREQALTIIQAQLQKVGVEMIPRILDPGLLYRRLLPTREFDAALVGWSVGLKMDLTPLFHSKRLLDPFNFISYRSREFDQWEEFAKAAFDRTESQLYWNKIAKHLSSELPYTWLYYQIESVALHKRFKDVIIDKRGAYNNLEQWWIPTEERTRTDIKAVS